MTAIRELNVGEVSLVFFLHTLTEEGKTVYEVESPWFPLNGKGETREAAVKNFVDRNIPPMRGDATLHEDWCGFLLQACTSPRPASIALLEGKEEG